VPDLGGHDMSGICGIVLNDRNVRVSVRQALEMTKTLNFEGKEEGFALASGSVAVGAQKFPERVAGVAEIDIHGNCSLLALHGSIYALDNALPWAKESCDLASRLLRLYVEEGIGFLAKVRGDFSVAVWDGAKQTLYLATDRFRVHPIFYYVDREKLVFSSRMKGIRACHFRVTTSVNLEAIVHIVDSSIIPTPKTIFREVNKVPPAHFVTYHEGKVSVTPYWEVSFLGSVKASEKALAREFRRELTEAMTVSLPGNGNPGSIGAFLSGGVDSSTVTGLLTRLVNHPIKAFSIGFEEERFNEINYARISAGAFGSEHYELFVTPTDTCNAMSTVLDAFDEPYANASAIPAYYCAKMARDQGVRVLYAGDGGDELFAGNERYATQRMFDYYYKIPKMIREPLLRPTVAGLSKWPGWEFFVKAKKYIKRASLAYPDRLSSYDFFNVIDIRDFVEEAVLERIGSSFNPYEIVNEYYLKAPASNNLDRHLYIDWKLTIADNDIVKVTRIGEAVGIAIRYPFLDKRLAEFAVRVPAQIKMRGLKLRSFQKRAFADLLPLEIRTKKKHGFGLPIPVWLRKDRALNELMHELVLSRRSLQRGYFKEKALRALVKRHMVDETSFCGTILWNLMVLELWHRKYWDGQ
jgi:asparagine synthase (glutamine-hydrolysing)